MIELPIVRMRLTEKGTLRMKLPQKGARWHGAYPNVDAAVKAAWAAGVPDHFQIHYVTSED